MTLALTFVELDYSAVARAWHTSCARNLVWVQTPGDFTYHALSRQDAEKAIQSVVPLPLVYDRDRRNCSEFAELMRSEVWRKTGWRGVGLLCDYGGQHWYCIVLIVENGVPEFLLVEPQSGKFVEKGDPTYEGSAESYDCEKGWVLL